MSYLENVFILKTALTLFAISESLDLIHINVKNKKLVITSS